MASPRLQCGKGLPVWHGWKNIGGSQKGICLRNVETGVQSKRLVYQCDERRATPERASLGQRPERKSIEDNRTAGGHRG